MMRMGKNQQRDEGVQAANITNVYNNNDVCIVPGGYDVSKCDMVMFRI